MTIDQALIWATRLLEGNGVAEPRREAVSLLDFVLHRGRAYLIAHSDQELSKNDVEQYRTVVERRANREPFQYITGRQEFFGFEFEVIPGVLIPRPETEMLVTVGTDFLHTIERPRFLEIGVGSGCIAISVLKQVPTSSAIGIDISEIAISLAARNAERFGVGERLELKKGDLFDSVNGCRFHAILSNPPYVPTSDIAGLQREVRDFEPLVALTDGGDGLSVISRIVSSATHYLEPAGLLALEFGYGQSSAVTKMFDPSLWSEVLIHDDFRSIARMVVAILR